jgi:2-polyprenyl-6-methoxyphenol hydroxylase-like FAD-dependent oxidoreductase
LYRAGCLDHDEVVEGDDADWVLEASGRPAGRAPAGQRVGQFARVDSQYRQNELSVTATRSGWIFTAPHPQGGRAVLLVSPSAEVSPSTEHEVAERLAEVGVRASAAQVTDVSHPEAVGPALAEPLGRGNRLRVGDTALALDPLCGDGIGFALRGALLAQAVLARIDGESGRAESLGHYHERLRRAFVAHLGGCRDYYSSARCAEIWKSDVAAMDEVVEHCRSPALQLGLRLRGRNLVGVAPSILQKSSGSARITT